MKVAIVGAGRMGRRHVEACQRAGYSVVGLADTKIDAAKEAAALVPGAEAFDSVDALLGMSGIDMVAIATTTVSHCELAVAAMKSGVRLVLVEKPLGRSLAECDEVIAVAKETGSNVAVNHPYRHMHHMRSLIELMRSEDFGGVSSMHIVGGNGGLAGRHLASTGGQHLSHDHVLHQRRRNTRLLQSAADRDRAQVAGREVLQ